MNLKRKRLKLKGIFLKSFIEFFILMCLILIFVVVYLYNSAMSNIRKEIDTINETTNKNFETMCEKSFREIEYIISKLMVDYDVRNFMLGQNSIDLFYNLKDNVCAEIQKYKGINTYINSVYIYSAVNNNVCDGYDIIKTEDFEDIGWLESINNTGKPNSLTILYRKINNNYPNVITFIKQINNYEGNGAVIINIHTEEFSQSIDASDINQEKYIITNDGLVLYAKDRTLIFLDAEQSGILNTLDKNDVYSEIQSEYYDWKYICITQFDGYRSEMLISINRILIIGGILLALVLIFSIVFAKESSKPVKTIADIFNNIKSADIEKIPEYEVESIALNIMRLFNKNEDLKIEVEKGLKRLNKVQLTALQLQINPHFLYNTLNSISMKARKENLSSRIPKMINNLAALMRMSLENKENLITIDKDVNILKFMLIY